jgi:hypothetical protein
MRCLLFALLPLNYVLLHVACCIPCLGHKDADLLVISDIHLLSQRRALLDRTWTHVQLFVTAAVSSLFCNPTAVIFPGDITDEGYRSFDFLTSGLRTFDYFRALFPRALHFAVAGNHDVGMDASYSVDLHAEFRKYLNFTSVRSNHFVITSQPSLHPPSQPIKPPPCEFPTGTSKTPSPCVRISVLHRPMHRRDDSQCGAERLAHGGVTFLPRNRPYPV